MTQRLRFAIFDLDDTLYPPDNSLWDELAANIDRYMVERVGIAPLVRRTPPSNGLNDIDYYVNNIQKIGLIFDKLLLRVQD